MATKSANPPIPATPADAHFDENRSVYGFFRRHQKKLLYTAGFFTLLTFSITGPLTSFVGNVFGKPLPMPTIVVGGARITLQPEDYQIGRLISHNMSNGILIAVMPFLSAGDDGQSDLSETLAILRRAAIAEGIEPSMIDVDRAINAMKELSKADSPAQMARNWSFQSLAEYREVVAEAMRIGTYVRLQTLVLDSSDANVLQRVLADREKITLQVATYDEKVAEVRLKAAGTLSDDDLRKWLEGKNDGEKNRLNIYDKARAQLRLAALLLGEGQFDPAEWQADALKDVTVGDEELKSVYMQEREARYKLEGAGNYKQLEDEAVKTELTRLVQAERVMKHLLDKLRLQQTEALKPHTDEVSRTQAAAADAERVVSDLTQQVATKQMDVTRKEQDLAQKPEDLALKEALAALQKDLAKLQDDQFQAKPVVDAKKKAVEVAEAALKDARAAFDFPTAFAAWTKDKKGFVQKAIDGLKNEDELKDLDANDFGLGTWAMARQATSLANKGDLCLSPGRTTKAVLLYQATELEPRPVKSWEILKPLLEGGYWTEQAKKEGEDKRKIMEAALLRLAKEKMPEKVTELEGKRQSRVDEKLAEWETKTLADIADAEAVLNNPKLGKQPKAAWQQKLDGLKAQRDGKEQRRKDFDAEIGKLIELDIAAEAKKFHGQVLDAAAAEAGFTVATVGPFLRDLQERPRFDKVYDPTVVFLFRGQSQLKLDETTGLLADPSNRRMHVAVCTKVEPAVAADVTRREFEELRTGSGGHSFADEQARQAYNQAFTLKALEVRYELQRPGQE